jgi:SAM-dependent methyltransferase
VLVAAPVDPGLEPPLRRHLGEAIIARPGDRPDEETFDTVLVLGIDQGGRKRGEELLERSWRCLRRGGRLVVCTPNREVLDSRRRNGALDRQQLRSLLESFGKPMLATDQPLAWLTMVVKKESRPRSGTRRIRTDRYSVTAALCRGRVVELGCGEGRLSRAIRARGLEVVGVDLSRSKIERARRLFPGIRFIESDIRALGEPDGSFDTAVIAEVLEHVPEPVGEEFVERAWRLIRPGGSLVVSVPHRNCVPHPNHVRIFTLEGLERMLGKRGPVRRIIDQPYRWLLATVEKCA